MRRSWMAATLALLLLFVSACSNGGRPSETEPSETAAPSTSGASTAAPSEETGSGVSSELYVSGETAVFVDPATGCLTRADITTGETRRLYPARTDGAFIAAAGRIYFRELDNGRICSVAMDGSDFRAYFKMPFSGGVYIDGKLYFAAENESSGEYVLYTYQLSAGEWSSAILSGSEASDNRTTMLYADDAVYYIACAENTESVVKKDLLTGERKTVFISRGIGRGYIGELVPYADGLCFVDMYTDSLYTVSGDGSCALYSAARATRIFAALNDGMLYASERGRYDTMLMGNSEGLEAECLGGVVAAFGGSRALVRRSGSICLVKYPEDELQTEIKGELICLLRGSDCALAVMEGDPAYSLFSFSHGDVATLQGEAGSRQTVTPEKYLSADSGCLPAAELLDKASAAVRANVFASAASRGDAETLNMLLSGRDKIAPYPAVKAASYELTKLSADAESTEFSVKYTYADPTDEVYAAFRPEILKSGTLRLELREGSWVFVWNGN